MDTETRVPLSITVRADLLAFALHCAASREIGSLDVFFDVAVEVFQARMDAILQCLESQEATEPFDNDVRD